MFIIFGTRGIIGTSSKNDVLPQCCPGCKNDLALSNLKQWFTLFFIPVFPFNTVQSFYRCSSCKSSYKQEARQTLLDSGKGKAELEQESKRTFARTLAACMTHMALIDGDFASEERSYINDTIAAFPDQREEMEQVVELIEQGTQTEQDVFGMLRKCSEVLTSEGIMILIGRAAGVLLADGKIEKEEETLMKEYLVLCGLPKSLYTDLVEKTKQPALVN